MASKERNMQGNARRESVNASLISKQQEEKQKTKEKSKSEKPEAIGKQNCPESGSDKTELDRQFDRFREEVKEMFFKFDESFDKKIAGFEKKLTGAFDGLKQELSEMKVEVYNQKSDMKELKVKMRDIEQSMDWQTKNVEDETTRLENQIEKYRIESEQKIEEMQRRMMWQEKHDRQYNLLFYGFLEKADEDLNKVMKEFFKNQLEIESDRVDNMHFANYHRLPGDPKVKAPKAIIVKFQSMKDRDLVFSQALKPVLKDEKKRILTDLPVPMKKERGRLAKAAYEIRQKEKLQTRIVEQGLEVFLEVRKDKKAAWENRDI